MQTVSLELSQKLYEKGLRIETEKWWTRSYLISKKENDPYFITQRPYHKPDEYPAPSTDELLAVMPYKIDNQHYLVIGKAFKGFIIRYFNYGELQLCKTEGEILPESLGKMCEWLLDNGWVYDEQGSFLKDKKGIEEEK